MQACKLSIAEVTHPSQVVKVWLDPISQSIALMLSDSSCLLYASIPSPSSSPSLVTIPAPSSDACFLRLQQTRIRLAGSAPLKTRGSGSRHKHYAIATQCDRGAEEKAKATRDGCVVFLSAMPDRGGSRIVLRAWLRQNQVFSRAIIEYKDSKRPEELRKQASLAGILDLPHGFSVKIAASVNVFVVYSASAGKIWVMAAKLAENADSAKLNLSKDVKVKGSLEENLVCIDIIKCSVVDCNGPIYSVCLSLQHMILGEENGVRVWPLRPLVKCKQKKPTQDKVGLSEKSKGELLTKSGRNGALDRTNFQFNSVENGQSNNKETNAMNKMDMGRNEGRGIITRNALKPGNLHNEGRETITKNILKSGRLQSDQINGQEKVAANVLKLAKNNEGYEKAIDKQVYLNHSNKNMFEILNNIGGEMSSKRIPRNGVIENAGGSVAPKPVTELRLNASKICCNGEKFSTIRQELSEGGTSLSVKGSVNAVQNWVDSSGCNCTNVAAISRALVQGPNLSSIMQNNEAAETSLEASSTFGNLVNSTLPKCELKLQAPKRKNGQICSNGTVLEDWYNQQQLSQLSSMSLLSSSSLSGPPGSFSTSVSASASSASSCASVLGSTPSATAIIQAPTSSLPMKSRASLKMRETFGKVTSYFAPFKDASKEGSTLRQVSRKSVKAVSIHALCETKFVVLDSMGELHILNLQSPIFAVEGQKEQNGGNAQESCLRHLNCTMKVNMLAVSPNASSFTSQKLWISDGRHSIHLLSFPEFDDSVCESDKDVGDEKSLQLSVAQAVFSSERIRAIATMSVHATLVLTQGSVIAYSIDGS
eukprot:Gb_39859 [translate_table: standard]